MASPTSLTSLSIPAASSFSLPIYSPSLAYSSSTLAMPASIRPRISACRNRRGLLQHVADPGFDVVGRRRQVLGLGHDEGHGAVELGRFLDDLLDISSIVDSLSLAAVADRDR
jgi:hypothetical protein